MLSDEANNLATFADLGNGQYLVYMRRDTTPDWGAFAIFGMIPIKYDYRLESDYLTSRFVADDGIPSEINLSADSSAYVVERLNGEPLCYIHGNLNFLKDASLQQWVLLGYFIGFLFLAIFLHKVSIYLATKYKAWMGAAFLIGTILNIRAITLALGWSRYFDKLTLFQIFFDIPFTPTLGDFLFNIFLLLWTMLFLHGTYRENSYDRLPVFRKYIYAFITYFLIILYLFFVFAFLKSLIIQTNLSFEFEQLLDLDTSVLLVVLGVICLLLALFLFSHTMMLTVKKMALSRQVRLLLMGAALVVSVPIQLGFVSFLLPAWYTFVVVSVFLLAMDAFVFSRYFNFSWLIIWLMLLSAIPALFLFQYQSYKDRLIREKYAVELSSLRDAIAENGIDRFLKRVKQDPVIRKWILRSDEQLIPKDSLGQRLETFFSNINYLHYNYSYQVYGFREFGEMALQGQRMEQFYLSKQFEFKEPTPVPHLQFGLDFRGKHLYRAQVPVIADSQMVQLYFEFKRLQKLPAKVYTELLVRQPYKGLADLSHYQFAIYDPNRNLVDFEGEYLEYFEHEKPPIGTATHQIADEYSDVIFHAPNGYIIVVSRPKDTFFPACIFFPFSLPACCLCWSCWLQPILILDFCQNP